MSKSTENGMSDGTQMVIVVINRWDDDFAVYHDYIDHGLHKVIYLVTTAGRRGIPEQLATGVFELDSSYSREDLLHCCRQVAADFGRIDRIIAMSEYDLPKAAFLRETLDVPGVRIDQAVRFTDKVVMKREIQRAGLRAPHYTECASIDNIHTFVHQQNYPLILKPKVGAASSGVHAVLSKTALTHMLNSIDVSDYECEEYIPGNILHVDGIVQDGKIHLIVASRYVNNCLAFNSGIPLGSLFIDDMALNARIAAFTNDVLATLQLKDGAFHIELIHSESDELVFLELNARVGGAEVTFVMRDLFNIDLVGAWVQLQVGERFDLPTSLPPQTIGGWLLIPEPALIPCEVVRCDSLVDTVTALYKDILPPPSHVFRGDGGYEDVSGRFRFKGATSAEVEGAIYQVLRAFKIDVRPAH